MLKTESFKNIFFSPAPVSSNLNRQLNIKNGVIISSIVNVKVSPDATSNDAFIIHEGLTVREEDSVDNWIKIRLDDGKEGWMPKEDIRTI